MRSFKLFLFAAAARFLGFQTRINGMGSLYDDSKVMAKLANLSCKGFVSYAGAFETLAAQSVDDEEKRIYDNLYSVCMLTYGHAGEPYAPFFVPMGVRPTFEVTNEQYEILANVVDEISDAKLKARVSDILWLGAKQLNKKDGFKYAKLAVESFARIRIDDKLWIAENISDDWKRGLKLAKSLGKGVLNTYNGMKATICDAFIDACRNGGVDNQLTWGIPQILDNDDLHDVISSVTVAKEIEALLCSSVDDNNAFDVYCGIANKWYTRAGLEDDAVRILKLKVQNRFKSIVWEISMPEPVWLRLSANCQSVIPLLQSIPCKHREGFDVDNKILFLKHLSSLGYKIGKNGMHCYQTPSVDITQEVDKAQFTMRAAPKEDVLLLFASLFSLREKDVEALAEKERKECVVPHIMGKSIIKGDKVVASAPAYSEDVNTDARMEVEKVQKAIYLLQCAYSMRLRPAYEVICAEHEFTFDDFLCFASESPLVPESHRHIFAEGLLLGWQGHFSASTYVLAPEIENALREQLKFQACDTTVVDSETKLENEVGLSTLVEKYADAIKSAFGTDFLFEVKAVFCSHAGPNVRNEIAHGLKDDGSFNGVMDFYVWWFAVRLLYIRART